MTNVIDIRKYRKTEFEEIEFTDADIAFQNFAASYGIHKIDFYRGYNDGV